MKKQKCLLLVLVLVMILFALTGCGKSKNTSAKTKVSPTFSIGKNNHFTVVYKEDFKEDYYSKEELDALIDTEVKEFNETYAVDKENGIVKKSFSVKNEKAELKLTFPGYQDYMNYAENYVNSTRNARLFIGTYTEAAAAGYSFAGKFKSADGKKEFNVSDVQAEEGVFVMFTNEKFVVEIDGEILGASSTVLIEGKQAVTADRQENYIIYKKNSK